MATPVFKSVGTIIQEAIDSVVTNSELTDINVGSIMRTILEAASIQDAEQYVQLQRVLDALSFETADGDDLDRRVDDFGLERLAAARATGNIQVTDTNITTSHKTNLDGAQTAPGTGTIAVDDTTGFPTSGTLILSRDEPLLRETVTYSGTTATTFTGVSAFSNDHPDNALVVLSQQGADETIPEGTTVYVAATSTVAQINFQTTEEGTVFDGDTVSADIPIEATQVGAAGKVAAGTITNFESVPFAGATVTNAEATIGGRDRETDSELVARTKIAIQSLSNATKEALESAAIGTISGSQEVVTAKAIDRVAEPGVVDLYIDDGSGFTPTTADVDDEAWILNAAAGQRLARADFFPSTSASIRLFKSTVEGTTTAVGQGTPAPGIQGFLEDTSKSFGVDEHTGKILVDSNGTFFEIDSHPAGDTLYLVEEATPASGRYGIITTRASAPLTEGVDFELNRTTMELELSVAEALTANQMLVTMSDGGGTPGYVRFTGLVEEVQKVISGDPDDLENFPGVAAAGVRVFISAPTVINQSFTIAIDSNTGVSESGLYQDVRNAVFNYVKALGVSDDIILSEIIAAVQAIDGIFDVRINVPTENVTIGDDELARTSIATITVT